MPLAIELANNNQKLLSSFKKLFCFPALTESEGSSHSEPDIRLVRQETESHLEGISDDSNRLLPSDTEQQGDSLDSGIFGSVRQRRVHSKRDTEPEDELTSHTKGQSQEERHANLQSSHLPSIDEGEGYDKSVVHPTAIRTISNVSTTSSGYFSIRDSRLSQSSRFSEISFASDQIPLEEFGVLGCSLELSGRVQPKASSSATQSPLLKSNRPDSPVPTKTQKISSLDRAFTDFEPPQEFRRRAGSLPESASLLRYQVKANVQKKSSVTSVDSDSSTDSNNGECFQLMYMKVFLCGPFLAEAYNE